jgi:hypothetical protein
VAAEHVVSLAYELMDRNSALGGVAVFLENLLENLDL